MLLKSNSCLLKLTVLVGFMFLSCSISKHKNVINKTFGSNQLILKTENKKDIILDIIAIDNQLVLQAKNQSYVDIEIILEAINKNDRTIIRTVLKRDSIVLKKWKSKDRRKVLNDFKNNYKIKSYYGNPNTIKPDISYLYRLPFKNGKKYEVSQSFNGKFSHNSKTSKYAIDFTMKIGEPVFAARDGIVIKTISHFKEHGGKAFIKKANRILIQHSDGTIASYVHLDYKGVLVKEGDNVKRGQQIGFSGFTGYTRGPHLHFVVRRERDIAIPVYFKGYENKVLQKGKRYKIKE